MQGTFRTPDVAELQLHQSMANAMEEKANVRDLGKPLPVWVDKTELNIYFILYSALLPEGAQGEKHSTLPQSRWEVIKAWAMDGIIVCWSNSLGMMAASPGGAVTVTGMFTVADLSRDGWPMRVTFFWLSASSGCSSTLCRQVLGKVCRGATVTLPLASVSHWPSLRLQEQRQQQKHHCESGLWGWSPSIASSGQDLPADFLDDLQEVRKLLILHCINKKLIKILPWTECGVVILLPREVSR